MNRRQLLILGFSFAALTSLGALACSGGSGSATGSGQQPVDQGHVVTEPGSLDVSATITAVTLGDDCGATSNDTSSRGGQSAACMAVDAGPDGSSTPPTCGGEPTCRPSNMQLAFTMGATGQPAHVEIVSVSLRDGTSGNELETLTSSSPQVWSGNAYATWDQTLQAGGNLKVTYALSSPTWSKMGTSTTYGSKYRVVVTLRIDGTEMVLESALLNREPVVAT